MELISIIVPIYNTEKYIRRCVNSIMCQTYRNLQIILVDDGSMDHSGMICDELAMQDKRIIVIHKMNGGLSDARNAGLEKAEGDYIGFVDSDDYVEEDMYETLYNEIGKKHADIVSCGYIERFPEYERTLGCQDVVLNKEEAYTFLFKRKLGCSCCEKLFKKKLFANLKFKKGIQGEDLELLYRLIDRVNRVVCINKAKYHYVHRKQYYNSCF